jgi:hypothetical protein
MGDKGYYKILGLARDASPSAPGASGLRIFRNYEIRESQLARGSFWGIQFNGNRLAGENSALRACDTPSGGRR